MVGREWSFPPAFIEEVNEARRGRHRRVREARRRHAWTSPVPYDVIIDRISHEVPYLPLATSSTRCSQGATVVNNPFMWTADDKFFGASLATKLGVAQPEDGGAAEQGRTCPASCTTRACATSSYPLDWEAIVEYVGLPCILKDAHGGGWRDVYVCRSLEELIHHYDQSGLLTMMRAGVHRVGPVRPLHVPGPAGHPADAVRSAARGSTSSEHELPVRRRSAARIVEDSLKLVQGAGLRHELDRVGGARTACPTRSTS